MTKAHFFLVNVLDASYYDDCHIRGSINVPLDDLEEWAKNLDRGASIVLYCASYICPTSRTAWMKLHAMGFSNIWAYEGGINEWYHLNLPVEGQCRQPYLVDMVQPAAQNNKGMEQQVTMDTSVVQEINAEELKKMIANSSL